MLNKIWQRYFLRELLKVFLLLISSFYALYMLIDYSSRTGLSCLRTHLLSVIPLLSLYLYYADGHSDSFRSHAGNHQNINQRQCSS